jgi:hypothetical protein
MKNVYCSETFCFDFKKYSDVQQTLSFALLNAIPYRNIMTRYDIILKRYDIILKHYDIILKRYDIKQNCCDIILLVAPLPPFYSLC